MGKHCPNCPQNTDLPYRILIIGGLEPEKTKALPAFH